MTIRIAAEPEKLRVHVFHVVYIHGSSFEVTCVDWVVESTESMRLSRFVGSSDDPHDYCVARVFCLLPVAYV
jgi:hypothetical protein